MLTIRSYLLFVFFGVCFEAQTQTFVRSELSTTLTAPWEIIYGPDSFLWISESGGQVSRVDPSNGNKTVVYTASDYFGGDLSEQLNACHHPNIGSGTLGMALHPDFTGSSPYIYLVYSYNNGSAIAPSTKFKIARLTWNSGSQSITSNTTLVQNLANGYDHLGGRLMIIPQNLNYYLFFSIGDNGISETNSPSCYTPPSLNPNNFVQDPNYQNGKIHRFHLDGSIPSDNPIPGNSFYTRGHRNPQGLMYNPLQNVIYDVEHGDRTDDEINILKAGMNYGWKTVRGYHTDNNYPGENTYISTYQPNPLIVNDALIEPLYAWCSTAQPSTSVYLDWCTVAPSDGIFYSSNGVPEWDNSLLVVTLKNGSITNNEVYQFKLTADGMHLEPSTTVNPNPKQFFSQDQSLNGRLRDICYSPDGKKIYLINNGGTATDKITVYSIDPNELNALSSGDNYCSISPNPSNEKTTVTCSEKISEISIYNQIGQELLIETPLTKSFEIVFPASGVYIVRIKAMSGETWTKKVIRL